jgi:uncharacterized membrane protein YkvA (DUF1232 family)
VVIFITVDYMILVLKRIWYFIPYLWKLLWTPEVSLKSKLAITFGGIYLISFIDLIPDIIPFLGIVDDAFITTFFVYLGLAGIPQSTLNSVWNLVTKKVTIEPIN